MGILDSLASLCGDNIASQEITLADGTPALLLVNPTKVECGVAEQGEEYIIVLHTPEGESKLVIDMMPHSKIRMVQVALSAAACRCELRQQTGSQSSVVSIAVGGGKLDYVVDLNGSYAVSSLRAAFLAGDEESVKVGVRVNHNVSDCNSFSLVKGVAGGKAKGEFEGMVYVAPDAQRTDAVQTSRNIVIGSEARINTKPQLEIYADDVKCSHGATVGQLDSEAVLYMRQRGLSLEQAKRLQIEGFVSDIVLGSQHFGEALAEELNAKLEKI